MSTCLHSLSGVWWTVPLPFSAVHLSRIISGIRTLLWTTSSTCWKRFCSQRISAISALDVSRPCAIQIYLLTFVASFDGKWCAMWVKMILHHLQPRAGYWVVSTHQLRFLARCRTRRLNQALSVLSPSLGFFEFVVQLARDTFCVALFCVICVLSLGCSC